MNTLRVKLAVLLTIVIISVISGSTVVLIYLFDPPDERQSIRPLAAQTELMERAIRDAPTLVNIQQAPAGGKVEADLTAWLRDALKDRGSPATSWCREKTTCRCCPFRWIAAGSSCRSGPSSERRSFQITSDLARVHRARRAGHRPFRC